MEFKLTQSQYEEMKNEILKNHFNFEFEKNKLKSYLGEDLYETLKLNKAIIAGGMISSLFTNKEINDIDVYFRSNEDIYNFAYDELDTFIISHTNKATQYINYNKNRLVQIIHYKTFEDAFDIFKSFDFTVCMGAFDFKTEEFIMHPDFLKHNSQKILKFNSNTDFPIISLLRVQKYENKGYMISKPDFISIVLSCMKLEINSYEELMEHLGGMYGENYQTIFEEIKDEEIDLQKAIDNILNISVSEDYYKEVIAPEFNYNEILEFLDKSEKIGVKINDKWFRVINSQLGESIDGDLVDKVLSVDEFYKNRKFYKYVHRNESGKLSSFYDSNFEYLVGEEIKAEKEYVEGNQYIGKLFFNKLNTINDSCYRNRNDKVIIEVSVKGEDVILENEKELHVKKCKVLRVVEESELNIIEGFPF